MELQILGAAKGVTGSCFSLSVGEEKLFVDCGMFQGDKESEKLNYQSFNINLREYSALLLTHAHLDHCGRIPLLVRQGFKGKIYATDATKALAFIVMADSAKIAMEDTRNENKRRAIENLPSRKPVFSMGDVTQAMRLFKTVKYGETVKVTDNISAKFYDAGHILGAASVQIKVNEQGKEKIIVFSGDLGNKDSILVKHTEPIKEADYVLMESTYGDRLHESVESKKGELEARHKGDYSLSGAPDLNSEIPKLHNPHKNSITAIFKKVLICLFYFQNHYYFLVFLFSTNYYYPKYQHNFLFVQICHYYNYILIHLFLVLLNF